MDRTLEQILKFDSGLKIGRTIVNASANGMTIRGIVDISPRGIVRLLVKPDEGTMYSSWKRVKGNEQIFDKSSDVIVWGVHVPEVMEMFEGDAKVLNLQSWFERTQQKGSE